MLRDRHPSYRKLSNSQVLLHPNPKGVIQFIGSFIFGSFPVRTYKYLHQFLFDQGYSLILYRFPLNPTQFNHWEVSLNLLKEQYALRTEIVKVLKEENKPDDVLKIYSDPENYLWLGHSLGCKYIILLEVLSHQASKRTQILQGCLNEREVAKIIKSLDEIESIQRKSEAAIRQLVPSAKLINQFFIRDQPSVLLAPEISNTVRFLKSGWRASNPWSSPNQKQTECLIRSSKALFNLTSIISFNWDSIAEDDVEFLVDQIKNKPFQPYLYRGLEGWHLEPTGIHLENLSRCIVGFFDELKKR